MSSEPTQVVVGVFPAGGAEPALEKLRQLNSADWVDPLKSALIEHHQDGTLEIKPTGATASHGGVKGAVIGGVIGLIFPPSILVGAAVGGGLGAIASRLKNRVVNKKRDESMSQIGEKLPPGTSGLVSVTKQANVTEAQRVLKEVGALSVIAQSLDPATVEHLEAEPVPPDAAAAASQ
jgi:uncharacterized membrane protein